MAEESVNDKILRYITVREQKKKLGQEEKKLKAEIKTWLDNHDMQSLKIDEGPLASLCEPVLRASYPEASKGLAHDWVTQRGSPGLIGSKIHKSHFSQFVESEIEAGREIPDFINVFYDTVLRVAANGYGGIDE